MAALITIITFVLYGSMAIAPIITDKNGGAV